MTYEPRPEATPECELNALAATYRFILNCHKEKAAGTSGGEDDANTTREARANGILHQNT